MASVTRGERVEMSDGQMAEVVVVRDGWARVARVGVLGYLMQVQTDTLTLGPRGEYWQEARGQWSRSARACM